MIFWYERVKCRITELSKARFRIQISTLVLFWWVTGPPPPLPHAVVFHGVHVGDNSLQEQSIEPSGLFFHTDTNTVDLNRLGWLVGWLVFVGFFFLIPNVFVSFTLIFLVKGVLL